MATPGFKIEALWETFQTVIIPWFVGRFMGRNNTPGAPPTSGGSKAEEPLGQQTTSVLKPRNDEAIQLAIDAALLKTSGGLAHLQNVQAVRAVLEPHQRSDWRKNIGTLTLTERFEHVLASETITRGNVGGQNQNQAAAGQPPRGQERTERKFERRPLDYEWTAKDPRVQHLILVSKVVSAEATPEQGIVKAKAYLLSAGLIAEQSTAEKAKAAATNAINRHVGGVKATDEEAVRLEKAIVRARNAATKQRRIEDLRVYLARRAAEANDHREENNFIATWAFRGFIAVVIIIGIVMAARA